MIEIFAVSLLNEEAFEKARPAMLALIPEAMRGKIGAFARSNDAQRSLLGEILARLLLHKATGSGLPDEPFSKGEKGKPGPDGFRGIHFNITHSGAWVAVALSPVSVGVDVEKMRKVPEGVARRFFSETENRMILDAGSEAEKSDIFFTLWTLKESFLKAIGKGLTKNLNSFTVVKTSPGNFVLDNDPEAEGYYLHNYPFVDGYKLSACSTCNEFGTEVTILSAADLLSNIQNP